MVMMKSSHTCSEFRTKRYKRAIVLGTQQVTTFVANFEVKFY